MASYRMGEKRGKSRRRSLSVFILFVLLLLVGGAFFIFYAPQNIKAKTVIKQSAPKTTVVADNSVKLTHYTEPDFTIDLPNTWTFVPRTPGPYQSYTWQSADRVTNGQEIVIFEDSYPSAYSVNRVQIVEGEGDHVSLVGTPSDNCNNFTSSNGGRTGVAAKWQGISFLCDQNNTERDVIGTSSTDGINTVILQSQVNGGAKHKFLFTYTDDNLNPDYSTFDNAITSLRMQ